MGGRTESAHPIGARCPPRAGSWHERLVALMGLPVVQAVQVRGDRLILLEREAGRAAVASRRALAGRSRPAARSCSPTRPPAAADAASAVDWFYASPHGQLVAFGVSEGGTENSVLRVVRTADGIAARRRDSELPGVQRRLGARRHPASTTPAIRRATSTTAPSITTSSATDWHDDPVVWDEFPTPETWPNVHVSPGGRYVLVDAMVGWGRTDLHVLDRESRHVADADLRGRGRRTSTSRSATSTR